MVIFYTKKTINETDGFFLLCSEFFDKLPYITVCKQQIFNLIFIVNGITANMNFLRRLF